MKKTELAKAASILGKKGGSATSEKKTKACKANGKLGGWPRGKSRKKISSKENINDNKKM
jgi:hypothetical protein